MSIVLARAVTVLASWFNDSSIYGTIEDSIGDFSKSMADVTKNFRLDFASETLWNAIGKLLALIGGFLEGILSGAGLDINSIIYGRLMKGSEGTPNYASFGLEKGNPYGIAGAYGYSVLRSLALCFIVVAFAAILCKGIWAGNRERALEKVKVSSGNAAISLLLLFLMPRIIEFIIYLRDLILYTFSRSILSDGTGAVTSLTAIYRTLAFGNPVKELVELINGLIFGPLGGIANQLIFGDDGLMGSALACFMYLSLVILSVYFLITYVSTAISLTAGFAFFPFVSIMSIKEPKLLMNWFKVVFSLIMVPVIDAILFIIPAVMVKSSGALHATDKMGIILFICCMTLIPARSAVRSMLGIGGSFGTEMAGIGAVMAMGRLAGQTVGAVKGMKESYNRSKDDLNSSKMYEALASSKGGIKEPAAVSVQSEKKTEMDAMKQERANARRSFVNTDNFEKREISEGLTDKEKAELYRKRAENTLREGITRAAGSFAGAGVSLAGSMFSSPVTRTTLASAGAGFGGEIAGHRVSYLNTKQIDAGTENTEGGRNDLEEEYAKRWQSEPFDQSLGTPEDYLVPGFTGKTPLMDYPVGKSSKDPAIKNECDIHVSCGMDAITTDKEHMMKDSYRLRDDVSAYMSENNLSRDAAARNVIAERYDSAVEKSLENVTPELKEELRGTLEEVSEEIRSSLQKDIGQALSELGYDKDVVMK